MKSYTCNSIRLKYGIYYLLGYPQAMLLAADTGFMILYLVLTTEVYIVAIPPVHTIEAQRGKPVTVTKP